MIRLRVKEIARLKGISQAKLSRRADLDPSTVRRIYQEPDEANVTLDTLNRLSWALGVTPCDLLEYMPDERIHE